ncbi:MaoC/PaaZ C-terminal domain-containing protein [Alisedimentitalea sp. MJ-SS2]|uniref:MaoC/PaaZ C-terminal domain-containing protein n=1 Tax=Aliisedimentitalea sp. MJ-SS2 TaxID=3049795 RepID=UPI00290CA001|nr:MaoC/PaaZ C-terminal domain-containing protein [Alisedimentitalea sp. MJ-SS2]MDU8928004.1 MaoC/PaaZ C-terminal domain-containing protein [Alisedimentitalea sp. MJ-SS2]
MTHPSTAQVGDRLHEHRFGPITRTTLALYAGASQDHNPIHVDTDFAAKAGLDDVFAHGMLSMAQLGRLVSDWAGQDNLCNLSTRFTAITPVGATVTCTGEVIERSRRDRETMLKIDLKATIDDGTVTLTGSALVRAA